MNNKRLNRLQERAAFYAAKSGGPIDAITKEILHYDILYTLAEMGVFRDGVTFQGGTALRLCYGGRRYSEDLDFATGPHFEYERLAELSTKLTDYLTAAYGLDCTVKSPQPHADPTDGVQVTKWTLAVTMDALRPDLPKQKIWIEFANVPAHTRELKPFKANFDPENRFETLISVETPGEIFADKILAIGNRPRLKARDLFDLKFLSDRNVILDPALVFAKLEDYHITDHAGFIERLTTFRERLTTSEVATVWHTEMTRFTDPNLRTLLLQPEFWESTVTQLDRIISEAETGLKQECGLESPTCKPLFRL